MACRFVLFMGGEFGQPREWNNDASLDWHLMENPGHRGIHSLVSDLHPAALRQGAARGRYRR